MTTDEQRKNSPSQNFFGEPEVGQQKQQASKGPMESTKWRSRSLSELPGHLKVPVLRRKDTERTQARLEAGVAGLAELKQLREQQTARVEQTVAASRKHQQRPPTGRKQMRSTENLVNLSDGGEGKLQAKQQPLSQAWSSTAAQRLYDISEERAFGLQAAGRVRIPPGSGHCLTTSGQSSWSPEDSYQGIPQTDLLSKQDSGGGHNEDISPSRQGNAVHRRYSDRPTSHTQHTGSQDRYNRNRLQRHHSDSSQESGTIQMHVSNKNMSIEDCCQNGKGAEELNKYGNADPNVRRRNEQLSETTQPHHHARHKRAASVDIPTISRATKYMSWDNLLTLVGLPNHGDEAWKTNSGGTPESIDTERNNDGRQSEAASDTESPSGILGQGVPRLKTGRSYSFCYDGRSSLLTTANSFSNSPQSRTSLDRSDIGSKHTNDSLINNPQQKDDPDDSMFIHMKPLTAHGEADKTSAIIRRASIQCETVLTGGMSRNRKIFNPLHDIDVGALRSPGPLHAVTLQYSGIPLNALPEEELALGGQTKIARGRSASLSAVGTKCVLTDSNNNETEEGQKPLKSQQLEKYRVSKSAKQPMRRQNLQPILETGTNRAFSSPSLDTRSENTSLNSISQTNTDIFGDEKSCDLKLEKDFDLSVEKAKMASVSEPVVFVSRTSEISQRQSENQRLCEHFQTINKPVQSPDTASLSVSENSSLVSFTPKVPPPDEISEKSEITGTPSSTATQPVCKTYLCTSPDQSHQLGIPPPVSTPKVFSSHSYPSPALQSEQPHQPDVSLILSDDGYSTCDSLGAHSRLSIGPANSSSSSSSSDWSSLSSGSVSNVSLASVSLISAHRRTLSARSSRFSHPPKSSRVGIEPNSKSCSGVRDDGWPSCSTLTHVPEGSNVDIAYLNPPCSTDTFDMKPGPRFRRADEKGSPHSNKTSLANERPLSPDSDSVFSDDMTYPACVSLHPYNQSCEPQSPDKKTTVPSLSTTVSLNPHQRCEKHSEASTVSSSLERTGAELEEYSVIHLSANEASNREPSSSCVERQETAPRHATSKTGRGSRVLIPNLGVKQTAV